MTVLDLAHAYKRYVKILEHWSIKKGGNSTLVPLLNDKALKHIGKTKYYQYN